MYFKQKGDAKLSTYYTAASEASNSESSAYNRGADIQAAYALTNHIAVSAAALTRKEKDVFLEDPGSMYSRTTVKYNRKLAEAGLGYFEDLNSRGKAGFTFFAGMGFGKFDCTDKGWRDRQNPMPYERVYESRVRKFYFQPGLNINPGGHFRMSMIHRFSFIHFGKVSTTYSETEADNLSLGRIDDQSLYFGETTFSMQVGLGRLQWLALEGSLSLNSQPDMSGNDLRARGPSVSVGICLNRPRKLAKP